ncbi:uncharacterized protein LOC117892552 [Drosophila subobscura]|uniref:uncharacterized protein LOC117892552 n=1 Tax=Drosophila subobscura TaxID=7241 RepID=UPI00155AE17D|nr:uncharacterized protein LOC117892552 [Drosophila subobscura]
MATTSAISSQSSEHFNTVSSSTADATTSSYVVVDTPNLTKDGAQPSQPALTSVPGISANGSRGGITASETTTSTSHALRSGRATTNLVADVRGAGRGSNSVRGTGGAGGNGDGRPGTSGQSGASGRDNTPPAPPPEDDPSPPPAPPTPQNNEGGDRSGPAHGIDGPKVRAAKLAASAAEVLAIIQRMFLDPIPNPVPIGGSYMPSGTEVLRCKIDEDFNKYSPVMWADPLIVTSITVDADEQTIDWLPAIGVDVNNSVTMALPNLVLSALGVQLKAIVDADISQTGAIRAMIPIPGLKDQKSVATIMHIGDVESVPLLDEAAIVRLMLFQAATMDPSKQVYVSTAVNEISLNTYVKRESSELKWTPALTSSDNLQIGTATETSTLYFRTIDEYAALIADGATDDIAIKTKSKAVVDKSNVIFIPVKSSWRGQAWLLPYIMSFTTTTWWNHAIRVSVQYTPLGDQKTEGKSMKMDFMPKAATVYIPGNYARICLVVIDSTSATFPSAQPYSVCKGITATRAGEFDFAKKLFAAMGRVNDASVRPMGPSDVVQALNRMIEFMCTRTEARVMQVKAAVLATSKMNGMGVYPSPDVPPKQGERQRDHIRGVSQFNSKDVISVGDFAATDLAGMKSESRLSHIKAFQSWRTDPLGYMAYGQVNCKKDAAHYPAIWKYTAGCIQYQLTASTANMRILRLCGVYMQDPECDRHVLQEPVDVYNTTLAYGALILGLTNWAAMELGVTILEHNRLGRRWRSLPSDYLDLWPLLTNGFVVQTSEHTDRLVDEVDWQHRWGWLMNQWKDGADVNSTWLDTHYSWNVPWWFVAAVAEKFGHKFTCGTTSNGELIMDEDFANSDNMLGWLIEPSKSTQFDLSMLTFTTQYEIRVRRSKPAYFDILTPDSRGKGEAYNMLSWNPYFLQDTKKLQYRTRGLVSVPDYKGIVELNIVVFPSARIGKMKTCPRAFVSADNRLDGSQPETYPYISGGLRLPDPWLDWLLKGGIAVIPRLLVGDYIGAINVLPNYIQGKETERSESTIRSHGFNTSRLSENKENVREHNIVLHAHIDRTEQAETKEKVPKLNVTTCRSDDPTCDTRGL